MIPLHLPKHGNTDWQVIVPQQDATSRGFVLWQKPLGAQWVYIVCVGPGGGGAGSSSTAGTARIGGGGGGSGGLARILIPAFLLPDVLYVRAAPGGLGGTALNDGSPSASASCVAVAPDAATTQYMLCQGGSGSGGTNAGAAGSGAASGVAFSFTVFGIPVTIGGQAGSTGGANTGAVGGSISIPTNSVLTGGAGGAGSGTGNNVFAGGGITGSSPATGMKLWPTMAGGTVGVSGSTPGGAGSPGFNHGLDIAQMVSRGMPLIFSGGAGGGSGGASNGGAGGPGAWGCGGGGGGAGLAGGAGGKGGDGFVIIGAF